MNIFIKTLTMITILIIAIWVKPSATTHNQYEQSSESRRRNSAIRYDKQSEDARGIN